MPEVLKLPIYPDFPGTVDIETRAVSPPNVTHHSDYPCHMEQHTEDSGYAFSPDNSDEAPLRTTASWGYKGPKMRVGRLLVEHPYVSLRSETPGVPAPPLRVGNESRSGGDIGYLFAQYFPIPAIRDYPDGPHFCIDHLLPSAASSEVAEFWEKKLADSFFSAIDRLVIADVGTTIAEIVQIKTLFMKGIPALARAGDVIRKTDLTSLKSVWELLHFFSSSWLTISYGLKPLVATIADICINGSQYRYDGKVKPITMDAPTVKFSSQHKNLIGPHGYAGGIPYTYMGASCMHYGGGSPHGPTGGSEYAYSFNGKTLIHEVFEGGGDYGVVCDMKGKLDAQYYFSADPSFLLYQLNLNNPIALGWELVPFSFIVDWFLKVGDFITSSELTGLTPIGARFARNQNFTAGDASCHLFERYYYGNMENPSMLYDPNGPHTWDPPLPYVQAGSMVSKVDARMGNALSLLVVLSTALKSIRNFDPSHLSPSERTRWLKLFHKLF